MIVLSHFVFCSLCRSLSHSLPFSYTYPCHSCPSSLPVLSHTTSLSSTSSQSLTPVIYSIPQSHTPFYLPPTNSFTFIIYSLILSVTPLYQLLTFIFSPTPTPSFSLTLPIRRQGTTYTHSPKHTHLSRHSHTRHTHKSYCRFVPRRRAILIYYLIKAPLGYYLGAGASC